MLRLYEFNAQLGSRSGDTLEVYAADIADKTAFQRESGRSAHCDENPAVIHKFLEVVEPLKADSAGNIVRFGGCAQTWILSRFLISHRARFWFNALNLSLQIHQHISEQDDVYQIF